MLAPAVRLALELGGMDTAERFIAGASILARDDEFALESAAALVAEANGCTTRRQRGLARRRLNGVHSGCPTSKRWRCWEGALSSGACRSAEAIPALAQAREILARLRAKPALEDAGMLLSRARE